MRLQQSPVINRHPPIVPLTDTRDTTARAAVSAVSFAAARYPALARSAFLLVADRGHAEDLVQSALIKTYSVAARLGRFSWRIRTVIAAKRHRTHLPQAARSSAAALMGMHAVTCIRMR